MLKEEQKQKQTNSNTTNSKKRGQRLLECTHCDIEGKCTLQSVIPINKSMPLFILFVVVCILTLGIPYLIIYWYPKVKKILFYRQCAVDQATHFYIINYDKMITYSEKKQKVFHFSYKQARPVVYFENRKLTYIVQGNKVKAPEFNYQQRINQIMNNKYLQRFSYNDQQAVNLWNSYGPGLTIIELTSIPKLLIHQIVRPIYLFIVFSCVFWLYQGYYYYAIIILVTIFICLIINLYQTYKNNEKICKLASLKQQPVNVIRNGKISQVSSMQLVPGDIVFLKRQMKIPFDGVLLQGQALVNQLSLTGQSTPVVKRSQKIKEKKDVKLSNTVYEGTNLIIVQNNKNFVKFDHYRQRYGVPVMVIRTNFSTQKGQILRILCFPGNDTSDFDQQSFKFLTFMFFVAILVYIGLCIRLRNHWRVRQFIQKLLDLITVTVPPGLPVSLAFSRIVSIQKLRKKKIYCSSPKKIIEGGSINMLCLDKTGTLTQDQTTLHSILLVHDNKFKNSIIIEKNQKQQKKLQKIIERNPLIVNALNNIAINHSLYLSRDQIPILKGNNMQLQLFNFGEFQLIPNNNKDDDSKGQNFLQQFISERGHKGKIFRKFQYQYLIQRMSAIGTSNETGDQVYLYVRGVPESMENIFRKSTLPYNYFERLHQYTQKGYKVIAIGSKKIIGNYTKLTREEAQKDICFDGFQIFQNKIRLNTEPAILNFEYALLRSIIVTGDSMISAANVVHKCGLLDQDKTLVMCDINQSKGSLEFEKMYYKQIQQSISTEYYQNQDKKKIRRQLSSQQNSQDDSSSAKSILSVDLDVQQKKDQQKLENLILKNLKNSSYYFCISGLALDNIIQKQRTQLTKSQQYILKRTVAFAKTKPNDKIKIISLYQRLGKKIAMCGKGVNNFGAFKEANIGLSFSMQQYSIAASFTTQRQSIKALQQLLLQCRAALICNFSLFNCMAVYSLIQFTSTILIQFFFSRPPSQNQYLYWDLFCNFLLFMTAILSKTQKKLSVELPRSWLFSISNFVSIFTCFMYQFLGQLIVLVLLATNTFKQMEFSMQQMQQNLYSDKTDFHIDQKVRGSIFLFTNVLYISSFVALNISKPFRKSLLRNYFFVFVAVIVQAYNLVMILVPSSRLAIFEVSQIKNMSFLGFIFALSISIGILMIVTEKIIYNKVFKYFRKRNHSHKKY